MHGGRRQPPSALVVSLCLKGVTPPSWSCHDDGRHNYGDSKAANKPEHDVTDKSKLRYREHPSKLKQDCHLDCNERGAIAQGSPDRYLYQSVRVKVFEFSLSIISPCGHLVERRSGWSRCASQVLWSYLALDISNHPVHQNLNKTYILRKLHQSRWQVSGILSEAMLTPVPSAKLTNEMTTRVSSAPQLLMTIART